MRGKGVGEKERRLRLWRSWEYSTEVGFWIEQIGTKMVCLFFLVGAKNFQGNDGAEGSPTNVAFKLWSSFTLWAAHLFVMLWSRKWVPSQSHVMLFLMKLDKYYAVLDSWKIERFKYVVYDHSGFVVQSMMDQPEKGMLSSCWTISCCLVIFLSWILYPNLPPLGRMRF